jgi:hypothetical protein
MRLSPALLALLIWIAPHTGAADPKPAVKAADTERVFTGKVVPLATILAKQGHKQDTDAATGLVLVTADGTTFTLVKDAGSRALFLDEQLQNRSMQITARQLPGSQILKVTKLRTIKDGKPHDFIYWCFNCQFGSPEAGPCKCCGGNTVLIETPVQTK